MKQLLSLFTIVILASACGGSTAPSSSIGGIYTLTQIDGNALPVATSAGSGQNLVTVTITAGSMLLVPPDAYTRSVSWTTVANGMTTTHFALGRGTYYQPSPTALNFISANVDDLMFASTATISGGRIVSVESGRSYLYEKN